jgi:hypothetical protein
MKETVYVIGVLGLGICAIFLFQMIILSKLKKLKEVRDSFGLGRETKVVRFGNDEEQD